MQTRNSQVKKLETPTGTSLACSSVAEPLNAKVILQSRREKTPKGDRMSVKSGHSVFVLSVAGKPISPTTPAKARRLLKGHQARKVWSKFGIFGIQMLNPTRTETPETALGVDNGTKFEGYSVVVGKENPLNIKLDLPDKKAIVKKLTERRILRRARRHRKCRRRPARFDNRLKRNWLAPSQAVIVGSRLKVIREFFRIYPISAVGFEDVRFNHAKHSWGKNFSTVEIGKTRIKEFFKNNRATISEYSGYETKELREEYNYRKTAIKNADKFTAHCSDSLTLAVDVFVGEHIEPGLFLIVDDTYRPKRRKLHDTQPAKGGVREVYSKGTVRRLRKGLLIGLKEGETGQLCGDLKGKYRYYDVNKKRQVVTKPLWISSSFIIRKSAKRAPKWIPAADENGCWVRCEIVPVPIKRVRKCQKKS